MRRTPPVDVTRLASAEATLLALLSGLRSTHSLPIARNNHALLSKQISDVEYYMQFVHQTVKRRKL